jgi:hypothetical protein
VSRLFRDGVKRYGHIDAVRSVLLGIAPGKYWLGHMRGWLARDARSSVDLLDFPQTYKFSVASG